MNQSSFQHTSPEVGNSPALLTMGSRRLERTAIVLSRHVKRGCARRSRRESAGDNGSGTVAPIERLDANLPLTRVDAVVRGGGASWPYTLLAVLAGVGTSCAQSRRRTARDRGVRACSGGELGGPGVVGRHRPPSTSDSRCAVLDGRDERSSPGAGLQGREDRRETRGPSRSSVQYPPGRPAPVP